MSDAVVSRVTGEARMIRRRRRQLRQRRLESGDGLCRKCGAHEKEGERQRQESAVRGAGQQSGAGLGSVFGWSAASDRHRWKHVGQALSTRRQEAWSTGMRWARWMARINRYGD